MDNIEKNRGTSCSAHAPAWALLLAFLCLAAFGLALYFVTDRLYRDVFDVNRAYPVFYLGMWLVILWYRNEIEPPEPDVYKKRKKLLAVGKALFLVIGVYVIVKGLQTRRTYISSFHLIFLLPLVLLPSRIINRFKAVWLAALLPCLLLAGTLTGVWAAGCISQPRAAALLREQGYENIVFQEAQPGRWLAEDMPGNAFTQEDMGTPLYLFSAEKDGERWAAAVSPTRGIVVGETPAPEGAGIADWLDTR